MEKVHLLFQLTGAALAISLVVCGAVGVVLRKNESLNQQQKMAWFLLAAIVMSALLASGITTMLYVKYGRIEWWNGFISMVALSSVGGLAPFMFRKKGKVQRDERDTIINKKVVRVGLTAAWFFVILACIIPGVSGRKITTEYLAFIAFGGGFLAILVQAVTTLLLYGWKGVQSE